MAYLRLVLLYALVATPAAAQYARDVDRRVALEEYHLGIDKMKAGAYEQAAAAFLRSIQHDRNQALAYYALGQAYFARERWDDAVVAYAAGIEALRAAARFAPEQIGSVDNREDVVRREYEAMSRRSADPFTPVGRSASLVTPVDRIRNSGLQGGRTFEAEFSLAAGSALYRAGRLSEAESEWRYAVSLHPELGEAWNNLAILYLETGHAKPALEAVHAARKAGFAVSAEVEKRIGEMQ